MTGIERIFCRGFAARYLQSMALSQKVLDEQGIPISFLRGDAVEVRREYSGIPHPGATIPIDGRQYIFAGEIIFRNGLRLPAHFEFSTRRKRPFDRRSAWCTPDDGATWYQPHEAALLTALGLTRDEAYPFRWRPNRPFDHPDPGPYAVDWTIDSPRRSVSEVLRDWWSAVRRFYWEWID